MTTLGGIVTKILSLHPKLGGKHETKKNYAENVLIPEGCEKFLIHKVIAILATTLNNTLSSNKN